MSPRARIYFDVPLWYWSRQAGKEWAGQDADPRLLRIWEVAGRLLRVRDRADHPLMAAFDRRRIPAAFRPPRVPLPPSGRATARSIIEYLRAAWAAFERGDTASGEDSLLMAEGFMHRMEIGSFRTAQPDFKRAMKHSREQSDRARNPRQGIVSAIAERLANKRDALGGLLTPLELWPELVSALDQDARSPTEIAHTKAEHKAVEYDGRNGERKTLTMGTWRATLRRARKESP